MKVYILTKKQTVFIPTIALVIVMCFFTASRGLSVAVLNQGRALPIYCVETKEKKISLTFNAAWNDSDIEEIISILDKYKVKSTFFIVGDWVDRYPSRVKTLFDSGHKIENHSDSHSNMTNMTKQEVIADINACNEKIKTITGTTPTLFRAPYGDYNNNVIKTANALNMIGIQWDIDSLDWKDLTVDEIVGRVVPKVTQGSIVLFHTGTLNTAKALPKIIESLQSKGYKLVPVNELLIKESYTIDHTGRQKLLS